MAVSRISAFHCSGSGLVLPTSMEAASLVVASLAYSVQRALTIMEAASSLVVAYSVCSARGS